MVGVIETETTAVCVGDREGSLGGGLGVVVDSRFDASVGTLVGAENGGIVDFALEAEQDTKATTRSIKVNALRRSFMFFLLLACFEKVHSTFLVSRQIALMTDCPNQIPYKPNR